MVFLTVESDWSLVCLSFFLIGDLVLGEEVGLMRASLYDGSFAGSIVVLARVLLDTVGVSTCATSPVSRAGGFFTFGEAISCSS